LLEWCRRRAPPLDLEVIFRLSQLCSHWGVGLRSRSNLQHMVDGENQQGLPCRGMLGCIRSPWLQRYARVGSRARVENWRKIIGVRNGQPRCQADTQLAADVLSARVPRWEVKWCNGRHPAPGQTLFARQIDRAAPAQSAPFLARCRHPRAASSRRFLSNRDEAKACHLLPWFPTTIGR
jgi:hypothetical protein